MKKISILTIAFLILIVSGLTSVAAQDDVKENPNAPADYDANLKPGEMAIGIGKGSPDTVKIVSKSGGVYKVTYEESPNKNIMYFKANSVYPYFDSPKLRTLVNEYRAALEPFVERYAAKHNLSPQALKGDAFQFSIGSLTAKDLKTRLDRQVPRLAELESRLKNEIQAFPQTFAVLDYNPALVKEIAENRDEYFQAMLGKKNSMRAEESVWLMTHRDDIAKVLKSVNEYDPATKISMDSSASVALYAVSPKKRREWLTSANALDFKDEVDKILLPLTEALAKKLPAYFPKMEKYAVRNAAEEALMKRALTNPARYKIFKSGLMQTAWQIDKNNIGIPNARYKNGIIYQRDTQADHPYCYATYINVIQDYAGGGRYAASRSKLVFEELVGCPAGVN